MNFKTPDDLFLKAKEQILHQDEALFALAVPLYYQLKLLTMYLKKDVRNQASTPDVPDVPDAEDEPPRFATIDNPPVIPQPTLFITGKTGSGKTHLIKTLCQIAEVNFIAVNATHISNSGYKGMTLADIGEMICERAKTARHAEFTVVFLDEFDKLFVKNTTVSDWHQAMATELLTIIEGTTDFPVRDKLGIDSRHMMFILGGSFEMHKDPRPVMGFLGEEKTTNDIPKAQLDLREFGLPDELAGRIGRIISMAELSDEMLKDILLSSPSSPLQILNRQIGLTYCTIEMADELLERLMTDATEAIKKFGVRGLYQAFNQLPQLNDVLADAPKNRFHHYVLTVDGFTKVYRSEYRPKFKIVVNPPPEPPPPKKVDKLDQLVDEFPF